MHEETLEASIEAIELVDPRPHSRLTPRVRRDVLVDRVAYRGVTRRADAPDAAEVARVGAEVEQALTLWDQRGWISDPASYHVDPTSLEGLRTRRVRSGNLRYSAWSWLDGFEVRHEEPGAARFAGYAKRNGVARASVLEHRGADRPWLVVVHGFGMGSPAMDLRMFRALHLFKDLGLNLAFLTQPFHGARNPGSSRLPEVPGLDVLDTVHAMAQSVWDTRQLLAHLRTRTSHPVGLMGLSLGGLVTGITASVDEPHAALALVPAVDLPTLMGEAAEGVAAVAEGGDLLARAAPLYAPISPLLLTPKVPKERRFILAGTLDRFAKPTSQATALWRHWDQPSLHWYHGGHVSVFWAKGVQDAIDANLRAFGLSA